MSLKESQVSPNNFQGILSKFKRGPRGECKPKIVDPKENCHIAKIVVIFLHHESTRNNVLRYIFTGKIIIIVSQKIEITRKC